MGEVHGYGFPQLPQVLCRRDGDRPQHWHRQVLTSLSTDGVAKEGRPKFEQPSTRPRIELGTFWFAVRDLISCGDVPLMPCSVLDGCFEYWGANFTELSPKTW